MSRQALIDAAVTALREATEAKDVLEAAGRLIALGQRERLGRLEVEIDLDVGDLDEDAIQVAELLARGDPPDEAFIRARTLLAARDAVELRRIAASALLGQEPELDLDEEATLYGFEEALRPALWRLTALNDWRSAQVEWMVPELRPRFWWWSEATDLSPQGALEIEAVAALVARFPEAGRHLEKLTATHLLLASRDEAEVVELRRWITGRTEAPSLTLAASSGPRERVLLEHRAFTLSFLPPDSLLIDLLEPCGPNRPRLTAAGRTLEADAVPGALERYRFDLEAIAPDATEALLEIDLTSGRVSVTLPDHSSDAR